MAYLTQLHPEAMLDYKLSNIYHDELSANGEAAWEEVPPREKEGKFEEETKWAAQYARRELAALVSRGAQLQAARDTGA
jgi:hypothetical protein